MQPSTRRLLSVVAIGFVGLNLVLIAMVVYPLSETDHRPLTRSFDHRENGEYRVAASITVDGEAALAVVGVVTASGERYMKVRQRGVVSERYQNDSTDGVEFERTVVDDDRADRMLQQRESDPDREIRSTDRNHETLTVVTVTDDPDTDMAEEISGPVSVVTTQLRLASYEPVDASDTGDKERLRPQSGWYNGSEPYRLTNTSGEVTIESETNVLYAAEATWDLTPNTDTYLHYVMNSDNTATQEISYQYDSQNVSFEPPAWVATAQA